MHKPLNCYSGILTDLEPFNDLALLLEQKPERKFKLELALATLHIVVYPSVSPPFAPHLAEATRVVRRLSNSGQISLTRALLEDAHSEP
jgi:hypothetical protein